MSPHHAIPLPSQKSHFDSDITGVNFYQITDRHKKVRNGAKSMNRRDGACEGD